MNTIVERLVESFQEGIGTQGLTGRADISKFGTEDFEGLDSAQREHIMSGIEKMDMVIDNLTDSLSTVGGLAGIEGFTDSDKAVFSPVQIAGAKMVARYAIGGREIMPHKGFADESNIITAGDLGITDTGKYDMESFGGQDLVNTLELSVASALTQGTQDPAAELMFNTVLCDPTHVGFSVKTRVVSVEQPFSRVRGELDNGKIKRTSVALLYKQPEDFTSDVTYLVPVRHTESDPYLLVTQAYTEDITGTEISTAPMKSGIEIPFLNICQTAAQLARGTMDRTDVIDGAVRLDKLFFDFTDGTNTATGGITLPNKSAGMFTGSKYGSVEVVDLQFASTDLAIGTSDPIFAAFSLPAGHTVKFSVTANASLGVLTGTTELHFAIIKVYQIIDSNGVVLAAGNTDYDTIKSVMDQTIGSGFTIEARHSNTNFRNKPYLMTSNAKVTNFQIPTKQAFSTQEAIGDIWNKESDAYNLTEGSNIVGGVTSLSAMGTLLAHEGEVRNAINNGIDTSTIIISEVNPDILPSYIFDTIDLSTIVDSKDSTNRITDIRNALQNILLDAALRIVQDSNYQTVFNNTFRGTNKTIGFKIVTDNRLKNYLVDENGTFGSGDIKITVESSADSRIKGKIIGVPGMVTVGLKPDNTLNYGHHVWVPTQTAVINVTSGDRTVKEMRNKYRSLHIIYLPTMLSFDVTNIDAVLRKVALYTDEVV